ncbi:hypothetical protein [Oerskovia enterophila]|uniref:hypothetical protein n=1 Tax=Oerskovia enterophila TaxID=43678 RepID=UPI0033920C40
MPSDTSPANDPVPHARPTQPAGPTDHVGPADRAEPRGARRRALTWGAGALTFSVLTLGGFALTSAPAAPGAGTTTDGTGPAVGAASDAPSGMTNLTDEA